MEVMSVGDSGIGIPNNAKKVPHTSEMYMDSAHDDSLLSSMYDVTTEDQGNYSGLMTELNKSLDTQAMTEHYLDSTRDSDGDVSESKDSGYGNKTDKGDSLVSNSSHKKSKVLGNFHQANMFIPKPMVPKTPFQKGSMLKAGKKGQIQPLNLRSKLHDQTEFDVNPEAVPFLPQNFMSSTVLKKIAVPKRHMDTFGGMEYSVTGRRGVILHTDRYHWTSFQPFDGMSQRDRLIAELTYMEKLKGTKRRREVLPHRAQMDLVMGGKKIEMEERFDITREIQKLKSLVLPTHARDLYHGRGFKLPDNHSSLKPRGQPYDITEEERRAVSASAPASLHPFRMPPDFLTQRQSTQPTFITATKMKKRGQLPSIAKRNAMKDESYPLIKSRHAVLPSVEANSLNRSPADWVADQNRRILEGGGPVAVPAPPIVDEKAGGHDSDADIEPADNRSKVASPSAPPPTIAPAPTEDEGRVSSSPTKDTVPHPLKGAELVASVSPSQQDKLRETFKRLDTDMDGSINYKQLKTQLPETFTKTQEKFAKHVFDITRSSSSFFGVEDFMNMTQLTQALAGLEGDAMTAFQGLETQEELDTAIKKFVELFQSVDRSNRGKISSESLKGILSTGLEKDLSTDEATWSKITKTMDIDNSSHITKLEFLAHLPYFLTLMDKS